MQKLSCFFRIFFKATYCLCLTPFKIGTDEEGNPVSETWFPQQVLCGILTGISITPHITHVQWFLERKQSDWIPPLYFRFFTLPSRFFWYVAVHSTVWLRKESFLNVLRFIENSRTFPGIVNLQLGSLKTFVWTAILLYSIAGFLEVCGMLNNFDFQKPNQFIDFQGSSLIFAIFQVAAFAYGCIAGFYWQLLQLFCIIILWLPSAAFAANLKISNIIGGQCAIKPGCDDWRWRSIKEQYLALRELSQLLNNVISGMIFLYTIYALSTYSYLLDSVFLTKMETDRVRLIARYINVTLTYLAAADICRKFGTLQEWITQDALKGESKTCSQFHKTNVLLHELNNGYAIGIRGFSAFTITYTFVANVASVIMTYFIICVQFRG